MPCNDCRHAYKTSRWDTPEDAERKKNGPPCGTCKPVLLPENFDPFFIYDLVSDQLIISPGGDVVGIYDTSVESVINIHKDNIDDRGDCHMKVKLITRVILGVHRKAKEAKKDAS